MGTRHELSCLLLLVASLFSNVYGDCSLQISQGALTGSTMTSLHGRDFCSYRGIPYAQPPVGNLRFRAPEPATAWDGELNATKEGNMCQHGFLGLHFGNEDCLYLNVFTPQVAQPSEELYPVLMFIHGGAFLLGNGNSAEYGPHYLLDKNIVYVTINYRLGALGYLSTGDDAAPGNYGFRDQLEALRWINKNIVSFGGDPNLVTIMGESAGGISVHYHVLSPLSAGLFHRAISDSGTALLPVFYEKNPLPKAQTQAQAVGCPTENTAEMVDCLRNMDIDVFMSNHLFGCAEGANVPSELFCLYHPAWRPVGEVQTPGNPEPFLPGQPQDIIRSGNFNHVPYMLGTNLDEGGLFMIFVFGTKAALDDLNANFEQQARHFWFLDESDVEESQISNTIESIANFYFGNNHTVTLDNVKQLSNSGTDRFMQHNVHKTVQLHLANGHEDIYLYNFAYAGKYSIIPEGTYGDTRYKLGVLHLDELEFSLSSGLLTDKWDAGHPDLETLDVQVTLIANFMRYGNPTPPGEAAPQGVTWPTAGANPGQETHYVFGHDEAAEPIQGIKPLKITVEPDRFKDRMDFWDSLNLYENQ